MTTIDADRWHIPGPVDAACVPAGARQADRLARIATLDGALTAWPF